MLQIPSSGFVGVAVSLVFSSLSVPKNSFRATPTTDIVFLPTKCVPSAGMIPFPHVAATGYAAIVFTSLFCILRAKDSSNSSRSRTHATSPPSRSGVGPPSPSPDPGSTSSTNKSPRWNPWAWLLLLVLFLFVLASGVAAYIYWTIHIATRVSHAIADGVFPFSRYLSLIEEYFFKGWAYFSAVKLHISLHGGRYFKILLLALASHSVCIIIVGILRRIRPHVFAVARCFDLPICALLVWVPVVASSSYLNWMFWMDYYYTCWYDSNSVITVRGINWHLLGLSSYLSSWAAVHFIETSIVVGVVIIHSSVVCFWTVFDILFGIPSTVSGLVRRFPDRRRRFLCWCILMTIGYATYILVSFPMMQYGMLNPQAEQTLWGSFSSQEARDGSRRIFWILVGMYQQWKAEQIEDFHGLTAGLQNTLVALFKSWLELWSAMPIPQKFLIMAPAIIFYAYCFHVINYGRSVRKRHRKRYHRWQTSRFSFLSSSLSDPVENRLAAPNGQ
ncbi:hypothetical protein DFH07DRAFT_843957 [Mycena maculata]|uniref:Uncharacterized protein n=1 Tax=Mycena maculata TaxID=230809 RepID=A0AAD7MVQ4_9AGAR|nr:hypothetical protein DFH07DRAFT_843957 [Mycena maculata]